MVYYFHTVLRYGGVQLGPDRFKHINNVARTLLQNTGMGIKVYDMYIKDQPSCGESNVSL